MPIGLHNLSEWGNLAILSVLAGKLGPDVLQAAQVSIIPVSAFSVLVIALAQAAGVTIADCVGAAQAALEKGDKVSWAIAHKNAKILGYVGMGIGSYASLVAGGLFVGTPGLISSLFIDITQPGARHILEMAKMMLLINGIGLIADMLRNVAGGNLRGYQDVLFVPVISFITMSIIGLTLGGSLALATDLGASWLFIARNIGIFLAAVGICHRFYAMNATAEPVVEEVTGDIQDMVPTDMTADTSEMSRLTRYRSSAANTSSYRNYCPGIFKCFLPVESDDETNSLSPSHG